MQGQKEQEANAVIRKCLGSKGIYASPARYRDQCWTRDFVLAAEPWLLIGQRADLLALVREHLHQLALRQTPDGKIPIMFLDNQTRWLLSKIGHTIKNFRMSFLLKRFLSKDGLASLSPWTTDSELMFVLGILQYAHATNNLQLNIDCAGNINSAIAYIENYLLRGGLMRGVDWRDTRPDLKDKQLLSNNCFLYQMYVLDGNELAARAVRDKINEKFWTGEYYRDYPETEEWDTLGNALAILYDVAPPEYWGSIFWKVTDFDTDFGYRINGVTLPAKSEAEAKVMARTNQYGVIWPFVHHFMTLALIKAGNYQQAQAKFLQMDRLLGFFEWYDPQTGQGHGSPDQLWSAALYLRVLDALSK